MTTLTIIKAIAGLCALCGLGLWGIAKWSKAPDPTEKEDEEEFDEKVIYLKDHRYTWRKKKEIK